MAKRKAAARPIEESSQTTKLKRKEKETSVSHSASAGSLYSPASNRECLFAPVLEMLKFVRYRDGEILTKPFLLACRHTKPITRQFGDTFSNVTQFIFSSVARMESVYESNPSKFTYLYSLVKSDAEPNAFRGGCATASLVCLTRCMDFLVQLFRNLLEHPDWIMFQACYYAYEETLKKWHDQALTTVKYVRQKEEVLKLIGGNGDVMGDIEKFCTSFTPLLKQNHEFLASIGKDDLKSHVASLGRKVPSTYQNKIGPALEELEGVKSESGEILTKHFLESCKKILPLIGNFENALGFVITDILINAGVLEATYSSNPSKFNYLYSLLQIENETGAVDPLFSKTFALLRVIRNLAFVVELFRNLVEHPDWITFEACNDSYSKTLKTWLERHQWFDPTRGVKSHLAPDREEVMEVVGGNSDVMGDIKKFCTILTPLLKEIHKFLASSGLDKSHLISHLIDGEAC